MASKYVAHRAAWRIVVTAALRLALPWIGASASVSGQAVDTRWVDARWMNARLATGDVAAVDLRDEGAFRRAHLPGARHLAAAPTSDSALWSARLEQAGLCSPARVVLYVGDGAAGQDDLARAWLALADAGVGDVRILEGGLAAWQVAGGPLETGRGRRGRACRIHAAAERAVVDREWVRARFGERGFELLDVRDRGWEGADYGAPAAFAAGHVPHALPFDVAALAPQGAARPDSAAVRALVEAVGPRRETRVDPHATFVLYGEGPDDPRPALAYLLLRAAGLPVRVFVDGWSAWTGAGDTPIVRIVEAEEVARLVAPTLTGARELAPDAIVLDLREDWDFRAGHVPGALALPARLLHADFERAVAAHWPAADRARTPVVFYCYGRGCIRSRDAATFVARLGFHNLMWFREGIDGWRAAGHALTERQAAPAK